MQQSTYRCIQITPATMLLVNVHLALMAGFITHVILALCTFIVDVFYYFPP